MEENKLKEFELIKKIQKGNKHAFKTLYDTHSDKIFSLSYRMVNNIHLAEEITQEIFVRAWEKINIFKFKSSFYTWLYRLAVNLIIRKRDKINYDREKESDVDIEELYKNSGFSESEKVENWIDYQRALDILSEQARYVFVLHDVEGLTHKEIEKITGIAEGTSKAHLFRARNLLKKELGL
ncbi:MAG TPA: RNA polymerase sigma factor [Spirochaetota bacterium]|nr:RNA polymerase sigma factor [Spirochaetota bacterium]